MDAKEDSKRTHEPSLRELTAQLDDLKELVEVKDRGLRELMAERDRRYEDRFKGQEVAVQAALAAQEKFNLASAMASKEAILKAEASQTGVNERSNEFRGQLADQAATLMPRKETEAWMVSLRELIDREMKTVHIELTSLRESRSEIAGRSFGIQSSWGYIVGAATIGGVITGVIFGLIALMLRAKGV